MTDLTRFSVDGCMEPDDEGQWVRYEDVAAPVAPALKYVDDPKQTGVGSWCAPGPAAEQKRMFVLRFEDQDRGEAHYTDEAEARAMFARAEARGWNCHLFVHVNRVAPVAPAEPVGCYDGEHRDGADMVRLYSDIPKGTLLYTSPVAAPTSPAEPTHLRRADGTLSGL